MAQELPSAQLRQLSFATLDPTDFEKLVFDLLGAVGFVNVDWRKGTPKKASPADGGRDIVAERVHRTDPCVHRRPAARTLTAIDRGGLVPLTLRTLDPSDGGSLSAATEKLLAGIDRACEPG